MNVVTGICSELELSYLFVTMTCNSACLEVSGELLQNQKARNSPDLCSHVFHIKLREAMRCTQNEEIFGNIIAYARFIEFQKRGLPHTYCIFFMYKASKDIQIDPEYVYAMISADMPPESEQELCEVVLKHSIHNPYRYLNLSAVGMVETDVEDRPNFFSNIFQKLRKRKQSVLKQFTK